MRLLVVEDEQRLASSLRRGLTAEGFDVDVAHDGLAGLEKAREGDYDAILLDIMLPGMSGYELCSTLRREETWTPVLMLTAKDGEDDHAKALDIGADDFLAKPFSFLILVAHIKALLRRRGRERPAVLVAGDLRLDCMTRRCSRGEQPIELSPREFLVLEYLMRHKGEVCAKSDILDDIWQVGPDGDCNILEVYIGYLRKRVDVPFGRRAIQTVRLVGYRLDPAGG